jgi:hypothetical protein
VTSGLKGDDYENVLKQQVVTFLILEHWARINIKCFDIVNNKNGKKNN